MHQLFEIFKAAGHELFFVGGFVRDKLRGVESDDIDFATSALPDETISILESAGFKAIPIGIEFGTIQTIVDGGKVEITTFRCNESYTKGSRKPGVVFGNTIEEDLSRRDFTFNAIAMREDGSLVDPFDGEFDLRRGIIRTPINPQVSFTDDPLRMLRACRFKARNMGDILGDTWGAMCELKHLVRELSSERVFEEMTKLLMSRHPSFGLIALADTGILGELFPELQTVVNFRKDQGKYHHLPVWEHTLLVVDSVLESHKNPELMWSAIFHDVSKPETHSVTDTGTHFYGHDHRGAEVWEGIAERLKTSTDFKGHVSQLIFEHQNLRGNRSDKAVRRLIHRLGDRLNNLIFLRRADILGHKPTLTKSSLDELQQLVLKIDRIRKTGAVTNKLPTGTGDRVAKALGIKPGPELGKVMKKLQQMVVDGDLPPDADFVAAAKEL